jgi:G3E family GTPase
MLWTTGVTTANRIPVTVLTGYLGAGKTTLLNRILSQQHGRRYAVIVNEFGEIGIDAELILNSDEELFEMNNGCICCTVRGDLIRTLHGLLAKDRNFDAILVETTGLADPGPVAQTFFVDGYLRSKTELDSVTTVVDALHIGLRLNDSREAREQIAFADQIILNKVDLVPEPELCELEARLHAMNAIAPIHRAKRAEVDLDTILGRGGFDLNRIIDLEPHFLNAPHGTAGHVHGTDCDEHDETHRHDDEVKSISLALDRPIDRRKIARWLTALCKNRGPDILRAKGIIDVKDNDRRLVFQAVHMILEGDLQREWKPGERRFSRLVFIGRNLDSAELRAGFESCVAEV